LFLEWFLIDDVGNIFRVHNLVLIRDNSKGFLSDITISLWNNSGHWILNISIWWWIHDGGPLVGSSCKLVW
jgi:hypothetical protein